MSASPTFREALRFWLRLGFISFGGPAGQIAIMQTELVERRKWIGPERFLHALNFCMLLPGPEATQLAIYCGWLLHRTRGGIVAGVLFVLPSAVILWGLSLAYVTWGQLPWVTAVFHGLKPAVVALVLAAMLRLGRKALRNGAAWVLAALAFGLISFWHAPLPLIVFGAAAVGLAGGKLWPAMFGSNVRGWSALTPTRLDDALQTSALGPTRSPWIRSLKVIGVCGAFWAAPILVAGWWQGWHGTLAQEGLFFSQAAVVTFGGAYAVLPFVAQQAVDNYHWLTAPQMLDGLGLAETTPGPLIMVLQFVGFLGAWNHPGGLPPLLAATLGAAITTWSTFVPCFLWIFLGAPWIERLRRFQPLNVALGAVTAAVVGVVLSLAVWMARQTLFPAAGGVDWFAATIAVAAFVSLHRFRAGLVPVIAASGLLGLVAGWIG